MARPPVRDTRHISLARALHARLYVNHEGRIFAAGGRIAHEKLAQTLARQDRSPTCAEAPTPDELGIVGVEGELSQHLLHCISRALNRWRKELAGEARRRPAQRRTATTVAQEHREIERLTARLAAVRTWHAELAAGGEPAGAPFFLDPVAEAPLQAALVSAQRIEPLTALIAWQARVVYWLSGECAARRFLSAIIELLRAYPKASRREQVCSFQHAVMVWKQRSEQEPTRNILTEIAMVIRRLAPDIVRNGRFSARLRGRTLQEHCNLLLSGCARLLAEELLHRWQLVPAALAALTAADGSAVALPQRCFRAAAETEDYAKLLGTIGKLAEQIGQPGYDAMLTAIDRLPEFPNEIDVVWLRQLLAKGNSLANCIWAFERNLLLILAESCLSIPVARRLHETFAQRGCPLGHTDLILLVSGIERKEDLEPIHAWLKWLGSVPPRALTPRMQKVVRSAFWGRYFPSVQQHRWFEQLAPCLAPPSRTKDPTNSQPLLDRIAAHQQLAGRTAALPKSLRKLLDVDQRRQGERELLRTRLATGTLDSGARARLQYLENNAGEVPDAEKIRRASEEAFLLLGIEALTAITRDLAEAKCTSHLRDLVTLLTPDQLWDFALWIEAMSERDRRRLRAVIDAYDCHGQDYKRHLAENQEWIGRAAARGIDLSPWFVAQPHTEVIGGQKTQITLNGDPLDIFLMGVYFKTCLSLGQCNQMSVLTNAYDANKQVVFMLIADGAGGTYVVARQLIAVSSDFKLLGYCCYVSSRVAEKSNREEVVDAMASYCGRLAAKCCLELADQGTPELIQNHFWYDDGEWDWPAAARAAWEEASRKRESLAAAVC